MKKTAFRQLNLDKIKLESGSHSPDSKFCVMELAAYIAKEAWSDNPKCVSPVIAAFLRNWNDSLDDDARQMLKPYAVKSLNTVGSKAQENKRAWMATDWLARECTPAFLRLAGFTEHAETLERLGTLNGPYAAKKAQPYLNAARDAAGAAAEVAAWDAAGVALKPTVKILQASALFLLDRMIAVTEADQ